LNGSLVISNRQRTLPVDVHRFRQLIRELLELLPGLDNFDLTLYLVDARRMARVNETFLQHEGPTDVITFDYAESAGPVLHGEIFICPAEAAAWARHFRTTWQSELARYAIHGVLHLRGFDDTTPAARRKMKREEGRLLRQLDKSLSLAKLAKPASPARKSKVRNRKS
jgi:probable rRNA maturation factor